MTTRGFWFPQQARLEAVVAVLSPSSPLLLCPFSTPSPPNLQGSIREFSSPSRAALRRMNPLPITCPSPPIGARQDPGPRLVLPWVPQSWDGSRLPLSFVPVHSPRPQAAQSR
ncbi:hypothetical protein ASPVEDRAFT_613519 [Aspergillus versicolor CBS 583.65]|uniref:Uncharacterized protein n=1 Tax=Aspergillus versicolor CBS 583.65 TaxID=1036611 RepID=A0A1L9PHT1_ASPVE|nr:uncharacterized protein ASPVEDRAFT_613519 [Aspergillus versicolor CBS 583.65]OJJ01069.1 hypothetical protein ASPVEDRAFT_613519 [Aspergillus versicolor CBS 583.65]